MMLYIIEISHALLIFGSRERGGHKKWYMSKKELAEVVFFTQRFLRD
jgi:hypothetical protein